MMKILKNCVQCVEIKSLGITMDSLPAKAARFLYIFFLLFYGKGRGLITLSRKGLVIAISVSFDGDGRIL